jgi:ribosomal protein L34
MRVDAQKLSLYFRYLGGKHRDRQRSAGFVARIAEPAERRVSDARDMICTQNGKGDRGLLRHVQAALRAANRMREIFESFCCTPPRGCVEFWDFAGDAVSNQKKISTINFYSWGLHCCAMAKTL